MKHVQRIVRSTPGSTAQVDQAHALAIETLRRSRTFALVCIDPETDERDPVVIAGGSGGLADFILVSAAMRRLSDRTNLMVMEAAMSRPEGDE